MSCYLILHLKSEISHALLLHRLSFCCVLAWPPGICSLRMSSMATWPGLRHCCHLCESWHGDGVSRGSGVHTSENHLILEFFFCCIAENYGPISFPLLCMFCSPASTGLASDFPDVNNGSGMCKPWQHRLSTLGTRDEEPGQSSLAFNTAETLILVQISSTAICLPNTGLKMLCVTEIKRLCHLHQWRTS